MKQYLFSKLIVICFCIVASLSAGAQENLTPEDYELPAKTVKATKTYATYLIAQQKLEMQSAIDTYHFSTGKITKYQRTDKTYNRNIEEVYSYQNNQLKAKDIVRNISVGIDYTNFKYHTEKDGNKITSFKTAQSGAIEKTLNFYNEAGELRGKTVYDTRGNKTISIEYEGKMEYRIRKFFNNRLTSDVIYKNNKDGKVVSQIIYTMPGNETDRKVLKLTEYNDKGDAVKTMEYHPAREGEAKSINKTQYTSYLYDGDIWVAKIQYVNDPKPPVKFVLTVRTVQIENKTYQAKDNDALIAFSKQVYQQYLNLK